MDWEYFDLKVQNLNKWTDWWWHKWYHLLCFGLKVINSTKNGRDCVAIDHSAGTCNSSCQGWLLPEWSIHMFTFSLAKARQYPSYKTCSYKSYRVIFRRSLHFLSPISPFFPCLYGLPEFKKPAITILPSLHPLTIIQTHKSNFFHRTFFFSFMHVLIAFSELQCCKLSSSPLLRLLSNIPRPLSPQPLSAWRTLCGLRKQGGKEGREVEFCFLSWARLTR